MIIKSTSRKDTNFGQIVAYIFKEQIEGKEHEKAFTFVHNIPGGENMSHQELAKKFKENDSNRKVRRKGNVIYHEFLSFSPEDTSKITQEMLEDLTNEYIERRAQDALVVARPEFSHKYVHVHLLISAVERDSQQVTRISKAKFAAIKKEVQQIQQERYPELTKSYVHERDQKLYQDKVIENKSDKQVKMESRGVQLTEKQAREKELLDLFSQHDSLENFYSAIKEKGYRTYGRGKVEGIYIKDGKQKRRFSTFFKKKSPELYSRFESMKKEDDITQEILRKRREWEEKNPDFFTHDNDLSDDLTLER